MRKYEIVFDSANAENFPKKITALVVEPDTKDANTGAMLFTHGWGNNRFQNLEQMEHAAERHNLVCVSAEYRLSGYDFDPQKGMGWARPYDFSLHQTFDVLNALRHVIDIMHIDRTRLFHYGTSQGGHIALLSSVFAPNTFAAVYATSPVVWPDARTREWAGREFSEDEFHVRNVISLAEHIKADLLLEHGTNDDVIPHDTHTAQLEKKLAELKKNFTVKYHENGGHQLSPATSRLDAFKDMMGRTLDAGRLRGLDDFCGKVVRVRCKTGTLVIDWGEPTGSHRLFRWE